MAKKFLLNILINIAIIMLLWSLYWTFNHGYYLYAIVEILALAMFIYLKIKLVKSIRKITKKP